MNKILKDLYNDPKSSVSFSTPEKVYNEAVKLNNEIKFSDVKNWFKKQLTYTLHKQKRNIFKRNRIIVNHKNEQWEADLVDLQEFKRQNNGIAYLLTVIDVFSKYAYVEPIKSKTGIELKTKLAKIFKHEFPLNIRTDKGKEFLNKNVSKLLNEYNINHFYSKNKDVKCAVIERFNRTLKNKMFKYFTSIGKRKYIDVLQSLVQSYNNGYHSSIKMAPSKVKPQNENEVFFNLYGKSSERELLRNKNKPKYKVNDLVRIKYERKDFDKGYFPNWTDEIYKIYSISHGSNKPFYILKTYNGNDILKKRFYEEEIQNIQEDLYRIEKILKKDKRNGKLFYFIKWLNYPQEYNSWISSEDLVKLSNGTNPK